MGKKAMKTNMKDIFKVSQLRGLLNRVDRDEITFSRFVEILNEHANREHKRAINSFDMPDIYNKEGHFY